MKKRSLIAICLVCLSFVGCQKFHTGKVVIDDKKNEEKVENVEYLVVDEEDKESLIKNIKAGKGAVIDKKKKPSLDKSDESADVTKDKDDKNNNNNNNSNNNNNR
jgi:hypothetical protein